MAGDYEDAEQPETQPFEICRTIESDCQNEGRNNHFFESWQVIDGGRDDT